MAIRISGVNIPNKQARIALTAIFGIGRQTAELVCKEADVNPMAKVNELTEEELNKLRKAVSEREVEGNLRRKISMAIKRKIDVKCYQGMRHLKGLPARGQRTHTNGKTSKKRGNLGRRSNSEASEKEKS